MFLTEEEARHRQELTRARFSSVLSRLRQDSGASSAVVEDDSSVSESEQESEGGPVSEDEQDNQSNQQMETSDIDRLLSGAVDYGASGRAKSTGGNLRGQIGVQVAVGATTHLIGAAKTGPMFGLSSSQSKAYEKGLSSTHDMREMKDRVPERTRRLKSVKEQLAEKASARLQSALTSLTDDKIEACNAPRISAIAKDMAVVLDKVTKETSKPESIHFHIWKPEIKKVSDYTTVHVSSPLIIPDSGGAG